ncbi:transmembrane protein 94 isoform X2 [Photinus pyralis]|uniref:transmembrane protein 94 isoform X2 n=1 Tax=Photinus pyralis TaxID=7054 RepID=UPI00126710A8|nr:transmembrane protein 94 isoform X2 [Photinus pyralis]
MGENEFGLTTAQALHNLQNDITMLLIQFKLSQKARNTKSWLRDTFHHNSHYTTINWVSIFIIVLVCLVLIGFANYWLTFFITILLGANILLEMLHNKQRHDEIPRRISQILAKLKNDAKYISWELDNYPHLLLPYSPCITLQWTYRDGKLVNLPWALLVKDDIVLIRPGQISPGYCESLDKCLEYPLLHAKEVYGPSLQNANEFFSTPKSRKPLENRQYRLLETPYLNNLKITLEQSLDRPITIQNQQRHFITIRIVERFILPCVLILSLVAGVIKYYFMEVFRDEVWYELFLFVPVPLIIPLIPLVFPLAWNFLNIYGIARFKSVFDQTLTLQPNDSFNEHGEVDNFNYKSIYKDIWTNFFKILDGKDGMLVHTANILHVMGSLTALCCVDKKGILSWPNPTTEKVFFLHNSESISQASSLANLGDLSTDADSLHGTSDSLQNNDNIVTTVAEVLDLTHDQNHPFKIHFDDTAWQKHLNSLKPLGLAILLNTCNEYYTKFCSHITCEAMYNENLIPVTNRRCLCELAREIGFVDEAQKIFALEQQLSSFRHLQNETARRDNKFARSLNLSTKLKFQFPHMFAVVIKELNSGSMQLLSQGTADMVLDSCIDYWDGHDLCPLTSSERKKIQDFYQRCSLTAYCTAFAYRPLHKKVNEKLSRMYLELPSDSQHLYLNNHSPTLIHCDCRTVLEPRIKPPLGQFFSTDSLLYNDSPGSDASDTDSCFELQCNQVFIGMVTMQYQVLHDMVQLIEQLEGACIRFVHFSKENELRSRVFSEKMGLESGWNCHISLLSERSRRESGPTECWANNGTVRVCSPADLPRRVGYLRNRKANSPTTEERLMRDTDSTLDSTKALSYSAPSAINIEQSVVKFDIENQTLKTHVYDNNIEYKDDVEANCPSHEWQSLSCLTDSTEQSAPINFDLSNRANLPRGIDKIRPHIENIDNVPLLVSLFTDCTSSNTKEMLRIMQDYGEVICVMGSSANYDSVGLFMQADASVAVEPLYPQLCQKVPSYAPVKNGSISPVDLSRTLNSVACSLSIRREDHLSIIYLIVEARHYMALMWNTVQFWLCACLSLSAMQLVAMLVTLPPLLTSGQVVWVTVFLIPPLCISLMGSIIDKEMMKKPQGKKQICINFEVAVYILWCYCARFVLMVIIVVGLYAGCLTSFCYDICEVRNCTCAYFYFPTYKSGEKTEWYDYTPNISTTQDFCLVLIALHLFAISVSFVHRHYSIWSKSPHKNHTWMRVLILLSILQAIFSYFSFVSSVSDHQNYRDFTKIPLAILIFGFLSPLLSLAVNEIIKREEIKANLRHQRRVRLDFGTKLGMNSPF